MLKTLIVEDSADFCQSLSDLLRARFPSMPLAKAENVEEAWKELAVFQPELVFVDIKLSQENGLDLARGICTSYPRVIVAVITAYDLPEYRQAAYQNGAQCFIPKGSASSADILNFIEAIGSGQPLQWSLGLDYINPSSAMYPGKT